MEVLWVMACGRDVAVDVCGGRLRWRVVVGVLRVAGVVMAVRSVRGHDVLVPGLFGDGR